MSPERFGPPGGDGPAGPAGDLDGVMPSLVPFAGAVSLMITARQRAELRGLGFSDATIREMTPREAHWLLRV